MVMDGTFQITTGIQKDSEHETKSIRRHGQKSPSSHHTVYDNHDNKSPGEVRSPPKPSSVAFGEEHHIRKLDTLTVLKDRQAIKDFRRGQHNKEHVAGSLMLSLPLVFLCCSLALDEMHCC